MFGELLSLSLFNVLLVFTRIGATVSILPGFDASYVPMRARLLFALACSVVIVPVVGHTLPASIPANPWGLGLLLVGEVLIGAFIGLIARIAIAALHVAGTVIAFSAAMANAMVYDPISQAQGAIVSGAFGTIGVLLLFVTDMHHLMLRVAFDSYTLFAPGMFPAAGDLAEVVTRSVAGAFNLGVRLAAPFLLVNFAFYLTLGLIARLMPQFPVFFIGLPLMQMLAFILLAITLAGVMMSFLGYFEDQMALWIAH